DHHQPLGLEDQHLPADSRHGKGRVRRDRHDARTDLRDEEGFRDLVVKNDAMRLIRLRDVATVTLGPESSDSSVYVNGDKAVFIGIKTTQTANPLTVVNDVRKMLPKLEADLPPG